MSTTHFDTLIIGAGISGISAAHYMQVDCPNKTYAILEGRKNIGGTWDLFRYPGIRSDSDMYTFGFAFRPWINPKSIAPRELIIEYLEDTVKEEKIDKHILFEHKVVNASWSSEASQWTLSVVTQDSETPKTYTCSFLSLCSGYYDYNKGYTPEFKGRENFNGTIVHPQKWTENINYTNKKVVVIGSGATAITMIPAMADKTAHITMLQRSPTYVVSEPDVDTKAKWINKYLPRKMAFSVNRFRNIIYQRYTYLIAKAYPKFLKKLILKGIRMQLGKNYDVNTHFNPSYNPWDQRLCLVPNGDLFQAINSGKASIVTDHIDSFTEDGIMLKSGNIIKADLIVTATGLNATAVSNFDIEVDGKQVDFSKTILYKGVMFSDVPNLALAFGYVNASWTLKCDMTNQYVCRVINFMEKKGYTQCCPRQNDPTLELKPFLDFTPGYIMRVIDKLPKVGSKKPWMLKQNYFFDRMMLKRTKLNDGILEFK